MDMYRHEMNECHWKLCTKQPTLVNRSGPIILLNDARHHVSNGSRRKIRDLEDEFLSHPPYSSDLSLIDYHMFRQLDGSMRNKQFPNRDARIQEVCDFFD
ncbi:UNVERIFIED_CONTAM: Histone-lysine N-methyltransferase SETMAR [Trichonephila clavipes]